MIVPSSVSAVISSAAGTPLASDHERVVAGCLERRRKAGEHALAVVAHERGLAVHELAGAHDLPPNTCADRLQPEADAEHRHVAGSEGRDRLTQDAGVLRTARPGRHSTRSGCSPSASSTVRSSLRCTSGSAPSSPRYWTASEPHTAKKGIVSASR